MKERSSLIDSAFLPVIVAPMFLVSGPALVTACCKAGVMASFPMPNARPIKELNQWFEDITYSLNTYKKENPDHTVAPFVPNMIVHSSYDRFEAELELIRKYQPPIVITSLGNPGRVVPTVHAYGGQVYSDVNSIKWAHKAIDAGVDGLILVAAGAGGHTGQMASFPFIEAVRKFFEGTLILAGGINSGSAILAAQALGADLAYMGTRFIAATESLAAQSYKQMLVDGKFDDLVLTPAVTGIPAHFIRQSLEKAGVNITETGKVNFDMQNDESGARAWKDIWSAGHGIENIHDIRSAKDIILSLHTEYVAAVQRITRKTPGIA
ncbi:nitronate monooxygenase [Membranicola marinus]|uniref:Nitronate monooxygenase n=1 Tax=Membranihabitans marinus TaxID=1227546 RepID=A0A953HT04_9BACT|nr:nitronate monooxygenase [Membranihabitans marinus]MBY5957681.1 nitronate monooxygenase [Membranihabitans marinus]